MQTLVPTLVRAAWPPCTPSSTTLGLQQRASFKPSHGGRCLNPFQRVYSPAEDLLCGAVQAIEFKKGLGCDKVGVLDIGAGSGLLTMMAAR